MSDTMYADEVGSVEDCGIETKPKFDSLRGEYDWYSYLATMCEAFDIEACVQSHSRGDFTTKKNVGFYVNAGSEGNGDETVLSAMASLCTLTLIEAPEAEPYDFIIE